MTEQEWARFESRAVEAALRRLEDATERPQRAPAVAIRRSEAVIQEESSSIPIARIVSDRDQLATAVAAPEAWTRVLTNKLRADEESRADCFKKLKRERRNIAMVKGWADRLEYDLAAARRDNKKLKANAQG